MSADSKQENKKMIALRIKKNPAVWVHLLERQTSIDTLIASKCITLLKHSIKVTHIEVSEPLRKKWIH